MRILSESDAAAVITTVTCLQDISLLSQKYDMYTHKNGVWESISVHKIIEFFSKENGLIFCFEKEKSPGDYYWDYFVNGIDSEKIEPKKVDILNALRSLIVERESVEPGRLIKLVEDIYEFSMVMPAGTEDAFEYKDGLHIWCINLMDSEGTFTRLLPYEACQGSCYISIK